MVDLALGTMYFGTRVDEATSFELLDRFVERGGQWLDTANNYAFWSDPSGLGGRSEEVIGRWLASRSHLRDQVRVGTKVRYQPTVPHDWPGSAEGLSAVAIRRAVEASLKRLRRDHIDLYWAHGEDRDVPLEETVDALGTLQQQGVVRSLGASNHATWRVERARTVAAEQGVAGYTAVQYRHSYVTPRPGARLPDEGHVLLTEEALDYASTDNLDLWVYTPLINGAYVRDDKPFPEAFDHPGTTRRLAALARVAEETGATVNQVVLAWLTGLAPTVLPIVGVSTIEQLDEAMSSPSLDADAMRLLDDVA